MEQPTITLIINNIPYSIRPGDTGAIRKIPTADRQHLITLLEQVKYQESLSREAVQQAVDKTNIHSRAVASLPASGTRPDAGNVKPERLSSGDIDALMARLVAEEQRSRKPGVTKQGLVKVIGGFALLVIFLVFIF